MAKSLLEQIVIFFQSFYDDIKSIDIDPNIVYYYQLGLIIGIFLTTTLALFPGKPLGIPYGTIKSTQENSKYNRDQSNNNSPDNTTASPWVGDQIPKESLKALQTKFKLTDGQMEQVMERSKNEFRSAQQHQGLPAVSSYGLDDARAFHNRLNRIVYAIILIVLAYVINRDYNDYVSFWFALYFPTEARTLGMFVPEAKSQHG